MITISINGQDRDLPAGATVASLLYQLQRDPHGVAVAVNGDVVPRSAWGDTTMVDGDRVEVLAAAQGG